MTATQTLDRLAYSRVRLHAAHDHCQRALVVASQQWEAALDRGAATEQLAAALLADALPAVEALADHVGALDHSLAPPRGTLR